MRFDVLIYGDGTLKVELNDVKIVAVIAVLLSFNKKDYKSVTFTISTAEDAKE